MGVTMFGGQGFMELQQDMCECVEEKELTERYKGILADLYKEHVKEVTVEETDKKLDKMLEGKDRIALGKKFYGFMKKFDQAIGHVDGRVGKNPPRPPENKKKEPKKEL